MPHNKIMPKKIKKSLARYISKIKNTSHPQIQLIPSKKWVLSGCKHPRTPSFALENKKKDSQHTNNKDDEATLADVDRFLFENFKSLYLKDDDEEATTAIAAATNNKKHNNSKKVVVEEESYDDDHKSIKVGSRVFYDDTVDSRGSNRFFMPRGLSESYSFTNMTPRGDDDEIISSSTSVSTHNNSSPSSQLYHSAKTYVQGHNHDRDYSDRDHRLVGNCVAVLASSESPYEDFKNSMQGMVDARVRNNQRVDWDFMEELLFCHINLNEKKLHKFILSAFVELVTAMRQQPENNPQATAGKPRSVRTVKWKFGREVRKKTKEVMVEFGSD